MKTHLPIIHLIIFQFVFILSNGQIHEFQDTLESNETWYDTIHVTNDIFIPDSVTLKVLPGTYIEFQGHYRIKVFGVLLAEGLPADSIRFTINDTTGFHNIDTVGGGWNGIQFNNALEGGARGAMNDNDSSVISYCILEYGKSVNVNPYPDNAGGAIMDESFDKLRISHCHLRNNYGRYGGAIYADDCDIFIYANEVENNTAFYGGGVYTFNGDPDVVNNVIVNNQAVRGGGISCWENAGSHIINNIITNNTASFDGGGVWINNSSPLILNNLIVNNTGDWGGGVSIDKSKPALVNNTVGNNSSILGGGLFLTADSDPVIMNNIVWGNHASDTGSQVFIQDENSQPVFNYCIIQDSVTYFGFGAGVSFNGEYTHSSESDPMFNSPSGGSGTDFSGLAADWSVQLGSVAVNGGNPDTTGLSLPIVDLAGNKRLANRRVDIGSYEFQFSLMEWCGDVSSDTTWIADTVRVTCSFTIQDDVTLTVSPGTIVDFTGHFFVSVQGTIKAIGTISDTIKFTCADTLHLTDTSTVEGSWQGFAFINGGGTMNDNDTSIFAYCIIEHAKKTLSGNSGTQGGAFTIEQFSRLIFDHSVIRNNVAFRNAGGIWADQSNIKILNTSITGNLAYRSGGGIYLFESNNAFMKNCIISDNRCGRVGGGAVIQGSDMTLDNCIISNNVAYNPGFHSGGIYCSQSKTRILNCKIINNRADQASGIFFYLQNQDSKIINSVIANNTSVDNLGSVYMYYSDPTIINSTIVNNNEGIRLTASSPKIQNSIIWNNGKYEVYPEDNLAEPEFYNCDIDGGQETFRLDSGVVYRGTYQNCIDSLPDFIAASPDTGMTVDANEADWSVSAFSPCINMGNADTNLFESLKTDLGGNIRINGGIIDMGAFENQDGAAQITTQPENQFACEDDSISFLVGFSGVASYQWQKDNEDIPGEVYPTLSVPNVSLGDEASYSCLVINSYATVKSNTVLLIVKTRPTILSQPEKTWLIEGESTDLQVFATGVPPISYQWFKDDTAIVGATSMEYTIDNPDSSYEGIYCPYVTNGCGITKGEPFSVILAPQICMVTISETTGNNLVVWEKKSKEPVMAYNIYRESVAAGIYDLLETIPYDDLSVFVDTNADPTVQAYLYKITAIDTAENETDIDLCKPHKTVHLIVSTNPELNTTQLQWDRYYGFEYKTYIIYRSSTGLNFDPVGSLSASLNSWTDPDPSTGDLFYRIAVVRLEPCTPEGGGKKAGTGPYYHSLSNMDDNKLRVGDLPPDTITLSKNSIEEENLPGMMIGKFFTKDLDSLDSHTYKFVPGNGDDDNLSFSILSDMLLASEAFDYETKNQYTVRIRSTDEAGNYYEIHFVILIIDIDESTGLPVLNEDAVKAFPNPFTQSTTINFPNPSGETYRMLLTDISGKVFRIVNDITTSKYLLQKGNLKEGLYFIELRGPRVYRGKIVIE